MTQENKELWIKDLCARVPYHPKGRVANAYSGAQCDEWLTCATFTMFTSATNNCRLYLRPMSSMTEEEKKDLLVTIVGNKGSKYFQVLPDGSIDNTDATVQDLNKFNMHWVNFDRDTVTSYLDWLNAHYFDYRGLIPKGLALEAHDGMYEH